MTAARGVASRLRSVAWPASEMTPRATHSSASQRGPQRPLPPVPLRSEQLPSTRTRPSLRTELLLHFGLLAAVAVAIALVSIMYFYRAAESNRQAFLLVTLIAADVAVFVVFGAYQLHRLFLMPLSETIPAIEAIAGGDLARRVPIGASEEFANLAQIGRASCRESVWVAGG